MVPIGLFLAGLAVAAGWQYYSLKEVHKSPGLSLSSQVDKPEARGSGEVDWTVRTEPVPELLPHSHAPGAPDGPTSVFPASIRFIVPEDAWITDFETEVKGADRRVLHHATLYAGGMQDPLCPNSALIPDIYASSAYVTETHLPAPYALFLPKGTELFLSPMLHNPAPPQGPGGAYHDVSIQVHLHGEVAADETAVRPVSFVRLRVDNHPCSSKNPFQLFSVPAATSTYVVSTTYDTSTSSSASFTLPHSGMFVGFGANFWPLKGGKEVAGYLNDKKIVSFVPAAAGSKPWELSIPATQETVPFKKGDTLRVEATYSNPNDYPIPDATAHLGTYVWYEK